MVRGQSDTELGDQVRLPHLPCHAVALSMDQAMVGPLPIDMDV